jgi:NTP pyrophosphatase (non-canonical NTP hydrolase)
MAYNEYSEEEMEIFEKDMRIDSINSIIKDIHQKNIKAGWWNDPITGKNLKEDPYVIGTKLLLVVSEIAEATEGFRKDLMDDKLTTRKCVEVELADAVIRIFDICGALNLDLGGAIEEKRSYNSTRSDHQVENRIKVGGKKF